MKPNTKSSIRSLFVAVFLLGSAAFFGYLFWNELNRTTDKTEGNAVGEIVEIRGQTQRRSIEQPYWNSLKGNETLFNQDSIRTFKDSGASIVLRLQDESGNEQINTITLGADTYIILNMDGQSRNINFVSGNISAEGSQGITVTAEDAVISLDEGTVNLQRVEGEETSISVSEGSARVNRGGEQVKVDSASMLRISEKRNKMQNESVPVILQYPKPNALLLTYNAERQVRFSWKLLKQWENPVLEISADANFSGAEIPVRVLPAAGGQAAVNLENRVWFWRVRNKGTAESSSINVFSVEQERLTRLVAPADQQVIPFRNNSTSLALQWEAPFFTSFCRVQLSKNQSFNPVVMEKNVTGNSLLVNNLEEGTWWWRVQPVYKQAKPDQIPPPAQKQFTLRRISGIQKPVLLSPPDKSSFPVPDVKNGINFRWDNQVGVESYFIEIALDRRFSEIVESAEIFGTRQTLMPKPAAGTYYWRVTAKADNTQPVPVSKTRSFTVQPFSGSITLLEPLPDAELDLPPYSPYTFTWKSSIDGETRFQLERVSGKKQKIRQTVAAVAITGRQFTLPMPSPGTYVWKVYITDSRGRLLAESGESTFVLKSDKPLLPQAPADISQLPPARPVSPRNKNSIDFITARDKGITLRWKQKPAMERWTVELTNDFTTQLFQTDEPQLNLKRLQPGSYTWRVRSDLFNSKEAPVSRSSEFTVLPPLTAQAPVLTSPRSGEILDMTNKDSILFTWKPVKNAQSYSLKIFAEGSSAPLLEKTGLDTNRFELKELGMLDVGSYTAELTAVPDEPLEGNQQSASSRVPFSLSLNISNRPPAILTKTLQYESEAPLIPAAAPSDLLQSFAPAPVLTTPRAGEVLDMTNKDSLIFIWQPVPDAQSYSLSLYEEGSSLPLFEKRGLINNSFELKNLEILDVGSYIVELSALMKESSGNNRESALSRVPFSLTLNISSRPPAILTETLQYEE